MKIKVANYIPLDIETIPDQTEGAVEEIAKDLIVKAPDINKGPLIEALGQSPDGQLKFKNKDELKEMWLEEFADSARLEQAKEKWLKSSFDGGKGQICAISAKWGGECFDITDEGTEHGLLSEFWDWMDSKLKGGIPHPVAHFAQFDLPFLYHRSVIHGVPPVRGFKPYGRHDQDHYCTMLGWSGRTQGRGIKLNDLAKILELEGKTEGMDGSKVWPEYQLGNIDKISQYCAQDVEVLDNVYKRMNFL